MADFTTQQLMLLGLIATGLSFVMFLIGRRAGINRGAKQQQASMSSELQQTREAYAQIKQENTNLMQKQADLNYQMGELKKDNNYLRSRLDG